MNACTKKTIRWLGLSVLFGMLAMGASSCIHAKTESQVEFKPIHITVDVNIKVDRELDKFFEDVDAPAAQPPAK